MIVHGLLGHGQPVCHKLTFWALPSLTRFPLRGCIYLNSYVPVRLMPATVTSDRNSQNRQWAKALREFQVPSTPAIFWAPGLQLESFNNHTRAIIQVQYEQGFHEVCLNS